MIVTLVAGMRSIEGRKTAGQLCGRASGSHRTATKPASPPPPESEDRWGVMMIAARDGDDRVYDVLLLELNLWLLRYFRRRLTPSASDDATQEVLLAIHNRRYSYEAKGAFGPWMASIARHKWMDCLRRQYRETELDESADLRIEDHGSAVRSRIVVEDLIDRLRPAQAAVVRLVKIEGASIQEAAVLTGQSPSLVKVNIHRALKKLSSLVTHAELAQYIPVTAGPALLVMPMMKSCRQPTDSTQA